MDVGDHRTIQELMTLRHYIEIYGSDILIQAFLTSTDITGNSRALRKTPTVPYFMLKDGPFVLDDGLLRPSFRYKLELGHGKINRPLVKLRIIQLI